jgi:hypothetical protein
MLKHEVFSITDELQTVLDNLRAEAPRSRLEPFRQFILRWRREGRSYRRIQQILASECSVVVTYETLRRFVKRRSRPRTAQPEAKADLVAPLSYPTAPERADLPPANSQQIALTDKYAAERERMRRHKAQPITPPAEKRFSYTDEDSLKPL